MKHFRGKKKVRRTVASTTVLMFFLVSMLGTTLNSSTIMAFQPNEQGSITFTITITPPRLSKMYGYDVIGIQGCGVTTDLGRPMLPVKTVPVLLPPDGDVEKIELISSEREDLMGGYRVFPGQHPIPEVEPDLRKFVEPDPAVYMSDKAYPSVLFENEGVQWMQGYKILNIRIFPVQYFPRNGKITYYKNMEFAVTVTLTGSSPLRNTFSKVKETVSEIVVNPEKADVWVAPSVRGVGGSNTDYVIITSTSFQDEFQALADWKIERGISACVYNTTWIYNNYAGADSQEKIRKFIIDMYSNHSTSMVLLGGDYNIAPPRYIYMEDSLGDPREAGGGLTAHYKPTDYYYACLDGNWDPDGDGKYLEQIDTNVPKDGIPETCVEAIPDFYPEVYVGRLPAGSDAEAQFLVNRTIYYEKNPPSAAWRKNALLLGAILDFKNQDYSGIARTDGADVQEWVKNNLLTPLGYNITTMYEKAGINPSIYACTYPLTQANVQANLSSGCWIMSTTGHGDIQKQVRKVWAWDDGDGVPETSVPVPPYTEFNWPPFIDATTMALTNGVKLPQVYIDACFNGKFDHASDCVAEWLVKLAGGGAIGVTAASRISYHCPGWIKGWPYSQELQCLFWQEFFNPTNGYRPGKALYNSKMAYYLQGFDMRNFANKKNHLIFNLLGDPDLYAGRAHNINTSLDYHKIQEAINAPQTLDGHSIMVDAGTYYENVVLNKSLTLVGAGRDTTVIDANGTGHVVHVTADNTSIRHFTIRNSGIVWPDYSGGIYIDNVFNCSVSTNNVINNHRGIWLVGSSNCSVSGNNVNTSKYCGILLEGSSNCEVSCNDAFNNEYYGTFLSECSGCHILGNNLTNNNKGGIYLTDSTTQCVLRNNNMTGNRNNFGVTGWNLQDYIHDIDTSNIVDGKRIYYFINQNGLVVNSSVYADIGYLALVNSSGIIVEDLTIASNNWEGVLFAFTTNSGIKNVTAPNNHRGVTLINSSNCSVYGSTLTNSYAGVWLIYTTNCSVYGNTITNNTDMGIVLGYGNWNCSVYGNTITNNIHGEGRGIYSWGSSNCSFYDNTLSNNRRGIFLQSGDANWSIHGNIIANNTYEGIRLLASNNTIFHNNFINNTRQVYVATGQANIWDDGYPSGGNYWSNYTGADLYSGPYQNQTDKDGIGDIPHIIDANNQDRYPLIQPWPLRVIQTIVQVAGTNHTITVETNATITSFNATRNALNFTASGPTGATGYINTTMPVGLNTTKIEVFVDGVKLTPPPFPIITTNSTHYFIYFEFTLSTHTITIQYAIADVAITNVTPCKTVVGEGYTLSINVTVANQGHYTETFNVAAYYNDTAVTLPDGLNHITITLTSLKSTTITFPWDTTGIAKGNYTITAEATPLPGETETADNTYTDGIVTVTIPGDVNGDFKVNYKDLFALAAAYGSKPEDPNWNPNCDIDGDNRVGYKDLFTLAAHYGEKHS